VGNTEVQTPADSSCGNCRWNCELRLEIFHAKVRMEWREMLSTKKTKLRLVVPLLFLSATACNRYTELPEGYHVIRCSKDEVYVWKTTPQSYESSIPAKVYKLWWNTRFICGKVHPLVRRSPENPNNTTLIADTSETLYYIIYTKTNITRGPLSEVEFLQSMQSLDPSANIAFVNPPFTRTNTDRNKR